eukprot:gene6657-6882_t
MDSVVEVPFGLFVASTVYIGTTVVIAVLIALLASPALVISRPRNAYWNDWNSALKAPWLCWHIGNFWYRVIELLGNYFMPAPQRVSDMASAYFRSQVIITVNELGVPEALEQGPKSGKQLAAELEVHQEYLERVLRVAERLKLICSVTPNSAQPSQKLYKLTQLSAVLCESHPNSVKHMVALFGDHFPAFAHLTEGVRTGQTPYKLYAKGKSHWEHMKAVPELYTRFNKAMTNFNNLCPIEAVFLEYSFSKFSRLVDVGGGLGSFVAAAMQTTPGLHGHLFDLPNVITEAKQVWGSKRSDLLGRMAFTAGSFFEAGQIPAATSSKEVYTMRQILHDWSDADCINILKQVRAAMGGHRGAKLVIVEACIASNSMTNTHTPRTCGDVHMLVQYGDAKERTEQQFEQLLLAAGFRLTKLLPTKSLFFVLEASPV